MIDSLSANLVLRSDSCTVEPVANSDASRAPLRFPQLARLRIARVVAELHQLEVAAVPTESEEPVGLRSDLVDVEPASHCEVDDHRRHVEVVRLLVPQRAHVAWTNSFGRHELDGVHRLVEQLHGTVLAGRIPERGIHDAAGVPTVATVAPTEHPDQTEAGDEHAARGRARRAVEPERRADRPAFPQDTGFAGLVTTPLGRPTTTVSPSPLPSAPWENVACPAVALSVEVDESHGSTDFTGPAKHVTREDDPGRSPSPSSSRSGRTSRCP